MNRFVLFLLIFISFSATAQSYIGSTKKQVRKRLEAYRSQNAGLKSALVETESGFVLTMNGGTVNEVKFTYGFSTNGKCKIEVIDASCDSCYQKQLKGSLQNKRYGWKKLNENQYVSSYKLHMIMELPADEKDHSFKILRTNWTRKVYDALKLQP